MALSDFFCANEHHGYTKRNDINTRFALKVIAAIDFALHNVSTQAERSKLINARRRYEKKITFTGF